MESSSIYARSSNRRIIKLKTGQLGKKWDLLIFAVIDFVAIYLVAVARPSFSGDTLMLIQTAPNILTCLHQGVFSSCPGVWHFPLSQFIPSVSLAALGFSEARILMALTFLNRAAFIASVILFYAAGKRWAGKPAGVLLAAVLLSGYGLVYATSSFNEAAAFFLIALFVYACLSRWNWMLILSINIAAGITKEIAPPFLMAMGLLAVISNWDRKRMQEQTKFAFILVLGFAASLVVNSAFNFFRYSSFQNVQLLAKAYTVPNISIWTDYFFMLLFSPNGGLLWAWPTWCILCFILIYQAIRIYRKQDWRTSGREILPIIGFLLLLLILNVGLAKWWSPFGWVSWGPRLTLPYLGGLLLLLSSSNRSVLLAISQQLFRNRKYAIALGCVVGLLSLPHVIMLIAPDSVNNLSNQYSSLTPALGLSPLDLNPHGEGEVLARSWTFFYLVVREAAWLTGSIFLKEFSLLKEPAILLSALPYFMMFPLLFVFAQENTSQLASFEKGWMPLLKRKTLLYGSLFAVIGTLALFCFFHLRSAMDIQWMGFSPSPVELVGEKSFVPNECGFVKFHLTIRELGLVTNISIRSKSDGLFGWSTDPMGGLWPLWIVKEEEPDQLLNAADVSVRIPVVESSTFLLYGKRDCKSSQSSQEMEAVVTYSDGRNSATTVADGQIK
jgi:hypothetical protein